MLFVWILIAALDVHSTAEIEVSIIDVKTTDYKNLQAAWRFGQWWWR
jgi:hypothetical protein